MVQCPNCGANVADGAHSCHNCGAQLGRQRGQGNQRQPQQGGRRQPQQGRQRQPQQGSQRQPQQGGQRQPQGGYRQGAPYGDSDNGLGRRELLIGGGATVTAAAGGWFFFLRESNSGGPEDVAHDYVDAVQSGDGQTLETLVHQDSPMRGFRDFSSVRPDDSSGSIQATNELRRESAPERQFVEEFAMVEVTISGPETAEQTTREWTMAKTPEGEWKLWRATVGSPEDVVYDYVEAINDGDGQALDNLIHPNSSLRGFMDFSNVEAQQVSVEGMNLLSRDPAPNQSDVDEFATVEATITGPEGQTNTVQMTMAKTPGGKWTIWNVGA